MIRYLRKFRKSKCMNSIFKSIQNTPDTLKQPKKGFQKQDINTVIADWQKTGDSQKVKAILQYIKPSIQSALHSYVPGQEAGFRVKATSLALNSLKAYTPSKGASPKTFIFTQLQRLNRLRRQRQNIIHIPQSQVYIRQLVQNKKALLTQDLGRQPSDDQLADATGMSVKKLNKIMQTGASTFSQSASNDEAQRGSTFSVRDVTDKDYFNYVYNSVGPIEKKIMEWTDPSRKVQLSNNEIAAKLRLSPGAVSQRKAKIQEMLGTVRELV